MALFKWLPIAADARVRSRPWATIALCLANLVAFAVVLGSRGDPGFLYAAAFKAAHPTVGTALGSIFVHAGPLALLANLLALSIFGPPLESRLGPVRYLALVIACGWLANLAEAAAILARTPELSAVPIAGAGGAVSGVLGLFLVRLPFARLKFLSIPASIRHRALRPARFEVLAAAAVALWFAWPVTLFFVAGDSPERMLVARLSGGIAGVLSGLAMGMLREGRHEGLLARGARHEARGDWPAALGDVERYLETHPEDSEALIRAARLLRVTHQDPRSAERFQAAIRLWLRRGAVRPACDAYQEMRRLLGAQAVLPPAEQLRVARGFEELGRAGEASRAYEAFGREYPARPSATLALLRSADLERRTLNNPGRARYIYEELLRQDLPADLADMVRERNQVVC
ncbi:MAG TPA: rhomboid family intramembrane serine protease [Candidatus Limnocylindrales bacterium]|nr:rhomboid family intramembrane serine protease [Candidatus Limnocylindrales bacterium]